MRPDFLDATRSLSDQCWCDHLVKMSSCCVAGCQNWRRIVLRQIRFSPAVRSERTSYWYFINWRRCDLQVLFYRSETESLQWLQFRKQNQVYKGVLTKKGSNKYKTVKGYTIKIQVKTEKEKCICKLYKTYKQWTQQLSIWIKCAPRSQQKLWGNIQPT